MRLKKIATLISFVILISILYLGCTSSSYSLRYKNSVGITSYDDSLKAGLIKDDSDDLFSGSRHICRVSKLGR